MPSLATLSRQVRNCTKLLSVAYANGVCQEAEEKGRWTSPLLFRAVREIAGKLGREVVNYWDAAWFLHVEGFHEARLDIDDIKERVENIEKLVKLVKKT